MNQSTADLLTRIEDLESELAEAQQHLEAIKAGEVGAFVLNKNNHPQVYTLESVDYAYRVLIENFNEGALNLSEDGLIIYTNSYCHELLGLPYDSVISTSFFDFVDPGSLETFKELFKKGLAGQAKGEINIRAGNTIIPVYVSLTTLFPTLPSVGMIVTDLSEKKIMEKEVAAKKSLQTLFRQAPVTIVVYKGKDFILEVANQAALSMWGKSEQEVLNKPLFEIFPELKEIIYPLMEDVYTTGKPFVAKEYPIQYFRHGVLYSGYFDFVYQPSYDTSNRIDGIIAIGNDVSESVFAKKIVEQSEKRNRHFAALVQSSEDAILSKTLDGLITSWNPGAEKLFGYTAVEMLGQSITKLIPHDRIFEEPDIIRKIEDNQNITHFETKRLTKDGKLIDVSLTISPIKDSDGKIIGVSKIARDITLAKLAEKQLLDIKNQLDLSISAGKIGTWHLDVKNNHLHWSKEQCDIYGITEKEFSIVPEILEEFVSPDELQRLQQESTKAFQQKKTHFVQQFHITRKDQEKRWVESRMIIQYDDQEKPHLITGVSIDITKEKEFSLTLENEVQQRTNELRTEKELSDTIINTTVDLIAVYDKEMRIIGFNKACEDFFNVKREAVMGKTLPEAFPAARGSKGEKDLQRSFQGETIHNEVYQSPVTGRFYENFITPLKNAEGEIYGAVAIAHDITGSIAATEKIKQSEEKFNKLFAASPLALVLSEISSGKIMDANAIYFEITGYSKQECLGKTTIELNIINEGDRQLILDELSKKGFVKNVEVEINTKSGNKIPVLNSIEKIRIGDTEYLLSAIIDITERKQNEQKIEIKNIELQKMNKELQSFAYISSHDLQEPLRKIQTFSTQLMEKENENLTESGKDKFKRMQSAASRMQALINDLLAYSRTTTTERIFEKTNLNKIIELVKDDLREEIKSKQATIETNQLCQVPIIPFQFRQLMQNLITNSLKFSIPDRPPHIQIKSETIINGASPLAGGQAACHITVTDNGIGFEPQYSEKIFELFQRLHGKNEYNGTGIGLAIVKKIVANHNGQITANSELSHGARFDIYIPMDNKK